LELKFDDLVKSQQPDGFVKSSPATGGTRRANKAQSRSGRDRWTFYETIKFVYSQRRGGLMKFIKHFKRILLFAFVFIFGAIGQPVIETGAPSRATALAHILPKIIPLPDGFQPEGVVVGHGTDIYAGSLATGAVYRADLRTGEGRIVVPPQAGRVAVGLAFDRRTNFLFVAGGPTGKGYVYDGETGDPTGDFELTAPGSFVNDVIVNRSAAYFTDSFRPAIYRVPLGPNGELPAPGDVEEIPLVGDFVFVPGEFNANGIEAAPDGESLIIVNSSTGELYRVDPETGFAALIDLGGETVLNGDGILLDGKTLYVVRNRQNEIAVVRLNPELTAGQIMAPITDPLFDVPTTIAEFDDFLYAVNARFGTPATPETEYEIVQVRKE
jgi:sugar lactone lactonase YvrE